MLLANRFEQNPYDVCIVNKTGDDVQQINIALHVDDLLVTSKSATSIEWLIELLTRTYKEVTVSRSKVVNYLGMALDFMVAGEVKVTMAHCIDGILKRCVVNSTAATPATQWLFRTRDDQPKATAEGSTWFHKHVAKILWVAKRVKPEFLTAVSYLTRRRFGKAAPAARIPPSYQRHRNHTENRMRDRGKSLH